MLRVLVILGEETNMISTVNDGDRAEGSTWYSSNETQAWTDLSTPEPSNYSGILNTQSLLQPGTSWALSLHVCFFPILLFIIIKCIGVTLVNKIKYISSVHFYCLPPKVKSSNTIYLTPFTLYFPTFLEPSFLFSYFCLEFSDTF